MTSHSLFKYSYTCTGPSMTWQNRSLISQSKGAHRITRFRSSKFVSYTCSADVRSSVKGATARKINTRQVTTQECSYRHYGLSQCVACYHKIHRDSSEEEELEEGQMSICFIFLCAIWFSCWYVRWKKRAIGTGRRHCGRNGEKIQLKECPRNEARILRILEAEKCFEYGTQVKASS